MVAVKGHSQLKTAQADGVVQVGCMSKLLAHQRLELRAEEGPD